MSFSHTLLEELQLRSGITMPGERTKPDFWRHEHHQAIFAQRWERRCKVFLQGGTEIGRIDPGSKPKTLRSKGGAYARGQSLSTILLTLVAVLLAGLLFFLAPVVPFFSGSRKSGDRQRRR